MDAVKFSEELARMVTNGDKSETVTDFYITVETKHPVFGDRKYRFAFCEDTVSQLEQWSKEHPKKTRLDDFLEKYPKARMRENGFPWACPIHLGYCDECDYIGCEYKKCWNEPVD